MMRIGLKGINNLPCNEEVKNTNLALKAKHVQDEESVDEEESADDEEEVDSDGCPSYDEMVLFVKKFSPGAYKGKFGKKELGSCYN